jgi:hypothetical protein
MTNRIFIQKLSAWPVRIGLFSSEIYTDFHVIHVTWEMPSYMENKRKVYKLLNGYIKTHLQSPLSRHITFCARMARLGMYSNPMYLNF